MLSFLLPVIYLAFISLGLPDSLLGSAWPTMYQQFQVPLSYAGIISMTITLGTVISSLLSHAITRRLGPGPVTAISVATTALALFGFSISTAWWQLILWAIPYGLGAGSVDAALNNFVALNYKSRHMSWLHCMWGIGATTGPYIMGQVLSRGSSWNSGYRIISLMQIVLTAILFFSLPLWNSKKASWSKKQQEEASLSDQNAKKSDQEETELKSATISLPQVFKIKGAKAVLLCFFCYSAVESTTGLWAASFLNICRQVDPQTAASYASIFYLGITIGRAISGFITFRLSDSQMIRMGQSIIAVGLVVLFLPFGQYVSLAGLILIGLGCAPIYPCIIHSTPTLFGKENSQALIGVQMAFAYTGSTFMPPLFGLIANNINVSLYPVFLTLFLVLMFVMHELLIRVKRG